MLRMQDLDLAGKRVLIRVDFNVPIQNGKVTSDARIRASLPTIRLALQQGAKVILMSHLGRPKEGVEEGEFSLQPVADHLAMLLGQSVQLVTNWREEFVVGVNDVVLLENVRFNKGEKTDDPELAQALARLCDIFVMDAFGTAHRAQASTHGVAQFAPVACAGPLLCSELEALAKAVQNPKGPVLAIVGGSKVSTKLTVLDALSDKVDRLIVGGGIANTFLAATGADVGGSLFEADLVPNAKALIEKMERKGGLIPIPTDVRVATEFSDDALAVVKPATEVLPNEQVLDIGPDTATQLAQLIQQAGTVIWNGPVGVFEFPAFADGTRVIAQAIANSPAFSLAGGGDTLAAIDQFGVAGGISYISTGGGAFLEYIEGKTLPAVAILEARAA